MRKLVLIAVFALLVLSLAACGKADGSAAAMPESKSIESNSPASSAASAASDTESNEPDIQFEESFQPQTIADNDTCTIILQNVGYDDSYGYYWTVDFQNKTDDKTLCAITSSSSLSQQPRLNRFTGYRRGLRGNL